MDIIDQYFAETRTTPLQLAKLIPVGKDGKAGISGLYRILKGQREATVEWATRVETATGGRISAEQFLGACLHRKRAFDNGLAQRLNYRRRGEIVPISPGFASSSEGEG